MKTIYIKTTWVDNKTAVNAANLNKIETAISDLYSTALSASEIVGGDGIDVTTTSNGEVEVSVGSDIMQSTTCPVLEVVQGEDEIDEFITGGVYLVLDPSTKMLSKIMINGVTIYEVE